jgi:nicotinamidase-related amidase
MPVKPDRAPLADTEAEGGLVLVIVDMISTWDFADAEKIAPQAIEISRRIGALKQRCARAGVPTIYVNDNRDRWRSEFRELVRVSSEESEAGAAIAASLSPKEDDDAVLKPKHSAFYATPLDLLLRHLRAHRLIITGVATDQCIAMSATEARMRDYEVIVPSDCVAAQSADRQARALGQLNESHGIATPRAEEVELPECRGAPPD